MLNFDEFLNYSGAKKPKTEKPTKAASPFPNAVNILSDEFMNGAIRKSAKFAQGSQNAAPVRKYTAVIQPQDNKPVKVTLIDSDAMRVNCPLEIVDYSDFSFAVYGETKKYYKDLLSLGGKFNNWLKRDGKPTPGVIFANWRKEMVQDYLQRF